MTAPEAPTVRTSRSRNGRASPVTTSEPKSQSEPLHVEELGGGCERTGSVVVPTDGVYRLVVCEHGISGEIDGSGLAVICKQNTLVILVPINAEVRGVFKTVKHYFVFLSDINKKIGYVPIFTRSSQKLFPDTDLPSPEAIATLSSSL